MCNNLLLSLMACAVIFSLPARGGDAKPFTVSIVPTKSDKIESVISTGHANTRVFYVVVKNVSEESRSVWEPNNSWGHPSLSFEFIDENGNSFIVSKKPKAFLKNTPDSFLLPSGGYYVYPIQFNHDWKNIPKSGGAVRRVKLRARYEVQKSSEASTEGVWVGKVESELYELTILYVK